MPNTLKVWVPGSEYGPCAKSCGHAWCWKLKRMAADQCIHCKQPIGFGNNYQEAEAGRSHVQCPPAPRAS